MSSSVSASDATDWMGELPDHVIHEPLSALAIPGSHDSFTFAITPDSDVAPNSPTVVQWIDSLGCTCLHGVIYNWAITQDLPTQRQLQAGIRYFDLRVASREGTDLLYFCHSLYAQDVPTLLKDVRDFLAQHPREVVLLDFNHFYDMSPDQHRLLLDLISSILGNKLWERCDVEDTTLSNMWNAEKQVLVFYNDPAGGEDPTVWTRMVRSPFPDTNQVDDLLEYLEDNYNRGRKRGCFYVTQGILTPSACDIIRSPNSTLRDALSRQAAPALVRWISRKTAGPQGINVVAMDFADRQNFVGTVIALNFVSQEGNQAPAYQ